MTSATYSKNPYWERTVFLYVNQDEDLISQINEKERSKIVLLLKGSILVTYQGATSCVISGPALLFIDEQEFPQIVIKEEIQAMAIYFHPSTLNDALTYESLRSPVQEQQYASTTLQDAILLYPVLGIWEFANRNRWLKLSPSVFVRCKSLIQQMQEELSEQKDGYWPCRSRSYLIELLIMITNLFEAETDSDYDYGYIPEEIDSPLLRNALEYIHTNYDDRITLEHLSREFGANRNLLAIAFKENFELTPMQYLIHHRIHVACSLLTDTELPVAEIALRAGFFDLSHFGRTFRKHMNCSPATYRKMKT